MCTLLKQTLVKSELRCLYLSPLLCLITGMFSMLCEVLPTVYANVEKDIVNITTHVWVVLNHCSQ